MYESGDLKKGLKIEISGNPYEIINFSFVKPGKGQALYKCKLKNMINGTKFDKTFRSSEKIKKANIEKIEMEYLYSDNKNYCFLTMSTYEQVFINKNKIQKSKYFLKENIICNVLFFKGNPIGIMLPNFIEFKIIESEPWIKGDTTGGSTKPAKIETGLIIQVPLFLEEGEKIKIDTRTGEYVERIK